MSSEIFTVSEINSLIKDVISSGFPRSLWICGEIQNLDRYKSKAHLFFDLVEKDAGAKEIKAKLGVTIWAGVRPAIEAVLRRSENAFELKDGIEVKFSGKVDFYPPYGTLRFVIDGIDPVYTLGKIAQDRQKLIAELLQLGVLAKNKTHVLSSLPLRIGLISSFDSAAYNDFMDELKRSNIAFRVLFYNAIMQGKNCEASICAGLKVLALKDGLDVIVITRGGGSIAELSAFDSKIIAMEIAGSVVPIVTGIGHEINISVADLAAHTYLKTPTAVAKFLVERVSAAIEVLDAGCEELLNHAVQVISDERIRLKENAVALQERIRRYLQSHKETHVKLSHRLKQDPFTACSGAVKVVKVDEERLKRAVQTQLKSGRIKIESMNKLVEMASPARIIKRGFSVTRLASGRLVRSVSDVRAGDELVTEVSDNIISSMVK